MEVGTVLGASSLMLHVIDKVFLLLKHFNLHSTCCGQKIEVDISTGTPPPGEKTTDS